MLRSTGFPSPCGPSPTPVPLPKPRARHELAFAWPQSRRASVCGSAAGVALRLRFARRSSPSSAPLPARRPQTEATPSAGAGKVGNEFSNPAIVNRWAWRTILGFGLLSFVSFPRSPRLPSVNSPAPAAPRGLRLESGKTWLAPSAQICQFLRCASLHKANCQT